MFIKGTDLLSDDVGEVINLKHNVVMDLIPNILMVTIKRVHSQLQMPEALLTDTLILGKDKIIILKYSDKIFRRTNTITRM